MLCFEFMSHNVHKALLAQCCLHCSSLGFSYFLGGASSVYKTNFPASAIKCILISNCTDLGLYIATPPSE